MPAALGGVVLAVLAVGAGAGLGPGSWQPKENVALCVLRVRGGFPPPYMIADEHFQGIPDNPGGSSTTERIMKLIHQAHPSTRHRSRTARRVELPQCD